MASSTARTVGGSLVMANLLWARRGSAALGLLFWSTGCTDASTNPPVSATCATPVALRVGEVREFRGGTSLSCVVVAAAEVATDYLFVAANATPTPDDLREYVVRASLGPSPAAATAFAPGLPSAPAPSDSLTPFAQRVHGDALEVGNSVEQRVRSAERALLGHHSLSLLASASSSDARMASNGAPRALTALSLGDTTLYRVGNAALTDLCANFATVRAVIKAVGRRATVAVDVSAPIGGFSDGDFQGFADEFDALTYPTVASWFGTPSDINNDGRITILFTPEINRLTPTGSLGFAGGFFFKGDLLPREIPSQNYRCAASNEQEILYLLVPDPNGQINGNRFTHENARESARGTMAHEMQHMISQGIRQASSSTAVLEVDWLNEGLSHFAEEVVGRAARGYTDSQRLTWTNVLFDLDDFDSYFRQNLLRLRLWLDRPDLASPISSRAAFELAPRGAAWALVRFAVDQYGGSNPRAFVRALVAGPQVDLANLGARTGVPFEQLLPKFLVASYGDVTGANVDGSFRFVSWNLRDVMESLNGGVYPLRLAPFPADLTTRSLAGSGNFFFASRTARSDPATFRMLAPDGAPVAFAGARVYVMRLR